MYRTFVKIYHYLSTPQEIERIEAAIRGYCKDNAATVKQATTALMGARMVTTVVYETNHVGTKEAHFDGDGENAW